MLNVSHLLYQRWISYYDDIEIKFYDGDKYVPSKEQIWATCKHVLKTRDKEQLDLIANACSAEFVDKLKVIVLDLEQVMDCRFVSKRKKQKQVTPQLALPSSENTTEHLTRQIEELRKQHEADKQTIISMIMEQKKSQELQIIQELKRERNQLLEELRVERKAFMEELRKERNISQNLMQTVSQLLTELKEQKQHKQKVNEVLGQLSAVLNK